MRIAIVTIRGGTTADEYQWLNRVAEKVAGLVNGYGTALGVEVETFTGHEVLNLGKHDYDDKVRVFSDETYWDALDDLGLAGFDQTIGLCHEVLESNSVNRQIPSRGLGIVTLRDYANYLPPGKTDVQYALYLFLCTNLCLMCPKPVDWVENSAPEWQEPWIEEHKERCNCLFDVCTNIEEVKSCLITPSLDHCKGRLRASRLSDQQISGYSELLKYVARRDPLKAASELLANDGVVFIFGASVSLVASVVSTEWPRVGIALAATLLAVGGFFVVLHVLARRSSATEPGLASKGETGVRLGVLAVLVLGIWLGTFLTGLPRLPSDDGTNLTCANASTAVAKAQSSSPSNVVCVAAPPVKSKAP